MLLSRLFIFRSQCYVSIQLLILSIILRSQCYVSIQVYIIHHIQYQQPMLCFNAIAYIMLCFSTTAYITHLGQKDFEVTSASIDPRCAYIIHHIQQLMLCFNTIAYIIHLGKKDFEVTSASIDPRCSHLVALYDTQEKTVGLFFFFPQPTGGIKSEVFEFQHVVNGILFDRMPFIQRIRYILCIKTQFDEADINAMLSKMTVAVARCLYNQLHILAR